MDKIKLPTQEFGLDPFRMYNNVIFMSCNDSEAKEQDFLIGGDAGELACYVAVMMNRHEVFKEIIFRAVALHDTAEKLMEQQKKEQ